MSPLSVIPACSKGGRELQKRSSITHCANVSRCTGQASTQPSAALTRSRSAMSVAGVMLSTIEQGKATSLSMYAASAGSTRVAYWSVAARRSRNPLPARLSQLSTVYGASLRARRAARPATR